MSFSPAFNRLGEGTLSRRFNTPPFVKGLRGRGTRKTPGSYGRLLRLPGAPFRYTGRFVDYRILPAVAVCAFLAGCSRQVESFAPPIQRVMPALPPELKQDDLMLAMDDPGADDHIVRDIQGNIEGIGWRWTHQYPELRFTLPRTKGLKFAIDFSFPPPNFKDTGPVTVSFFINGKLLDKTRYTAPGDKRFEKTVPPGWLKTGETTTVRAEIDPPWVAPTDKAKLGFVLHRVGFID